MSQVTFIFLSQIYYKMNLITLSQTMISIKDFPSTLRTISANCFWRTMFRSTQKCVFLKMSAKLVLNNYTFS